MKNLKTFLEQEIETFQSVLSPPIIVNYWVCISQQI